MLAKTTVCKNCRFSHSNGAGDVDVVSALMHLILCGCTSPQLVQWSINIKSHYSSRASNGVYMYSFLWITLTFDLCFSVVQHYTFIFYKNSKFQLSLTVLIFYKRYFAHVTPWPPRNICLKCILWSILHIYVIIFRLEWIFSEIAF